MRPSTDAAVMLGLAHSLLVSGKHDEDFLDDYCVGWEQLRAYLLGEPDGVPKTADWASSISGVDVDRIRALALEMAAMRTLITVSWSVQRNDHGEQPYWMAAALAAMLGQIGLAGGGVGYGYGAVGLNGHPVGYHTLPRLPQGKNPVTDFIPVARIADLLLHGGEEFDYNGKRRVYPETHLVYWAGGNPFHHHQDLNRLAWAWQAPDTMICHEPFWNALARHCDIVLPATTPLERTDIGGSGNDDFIFWMEQVIDPVGEARNDYDIFSDLARRLGVDDRFTEGRTANEWLEHIYSRFLSHHPDYPALDELREAGNFQIPEEWIRAPHITDRRVPRRPGELAAEDAFGSGRVVLGDNREFRLRRLPGASFMVGAGRMARQGWPLSPPHDLESAEDSAPLPMGPWRDQSQRQGRWPGADRDQPGGRRACGLQGGDLVRVFNERGGRVWRRRRSERT